MDPLTSANSIGPVHPIVPTGSIGTGSDAPARRAVGKARPVELSSDRVDATESTVADRRSHRADSNENREHPSDERQLEAPGARARDRMAERLEKAREQQRQEAADRKAEDRELTVRYQVQPNSPTGIQTHVVDRETEEVVRSFPSDEQLRIAESSERYLGHHIDLLA